MGEGSKGRWKLARGKLTMKCKEGTWRDIRRKRHKRGREAEPKLEIVRESLSPE